MPDVSGMDQAGALLASMDLENAKETSSRLALSSSMTSILKLFLLSFAWNPILLTSFLKARFAHPDSVSIGTESTNARLQNRLSSTKLKWPPSLKIFNQLTPMFLGWSSTANTTADQKALLNQTWSPMSAPFTRALKKSQHANDQKSKSK